jgi:hypothetical protein
MLDEVRDAQSLLKEMLNKGEWKWKQMT